MSKNKERWGIFLLGPLGEERRYCMVRAASYISARTLAMEHLGGSWDQAPAEVVGDALIDEFPRILLVNRGESLGTNPCREIDTSVITDNRWLLAYLGYGIRRAADGDYNVESLDRRRWLGTFREDPYHESVSEYRKDEIGIFATYDIAKERLMHHVQSHRESN